MRILASVAADDLEVMKWALTTVQTRLQRRLKSARTSSELFQAEAQKFRETLNHFDQGYLDARDVVVLLSAFYALEEDYMQTFHEWSAGQPAPTETSFRAAFEQARRLPYMEALQA